MRRAVVERLEENVGHTANVDLKAVTLDAIRDAKKEWAYQDSLYIFDLRKPPDIGNAPLTISAASQRAYQAAEAALTAYLIKGLGNDDQRPRPREMAPRRHGNRQRIRHAQGLAVSRMPEASMARIGRR